MTARMFPAEFIVLLSSCVIKTYQDSEYGYVFQALTVPKHLSKDMFDACSIKKWLTSSLNQHSWHFMGI